MKRSNLEITKDILNCFNENDSKALKALLRAKTQGLTDIEEQILAIIISDDDRKQVIGEKLD